MPSYREFECLIEQPRGEGAKEVRKFTGAKEMLRWFNGFHSWRHKLKTRRPGDHAKAMRIHLSQDKETDTLTIAYDAKPTGVKRMKPVKIARYPDYCLGLAREAGKTRSIKLKDRKAAEALRFNLYGLRRAIEKEGAEELYADFMRAVVRIDGNTVIISQPDEADMETRAAVLAALGRDFEVVEEKHTAPSKPEPASDPYALYMPPEYHNTEAIDREFESRIDAWLASAPIQDTQHTGDEAEK